METENIMTRRVLVVQVVCLTPMFNDPVWETKVFSGRMEEVVKCRAWEWVVSQGKPGTNGHLIGQWDDEVGETTRESVPQTLEGLVDWFTDRQENYETSIDEPKVVQFEWVAVA